MKVVVGPEGIAVCFSHLGHVWDLKAEWTSRVSMPAQDRCQRPITDRVQPRKEVSSMCASDIGCEVPVDHAEGVLPRVSALDARRSSSSMAIWAPRKMPPIVADPCKFHMSGRCCGGHHQEGYSVEAVEAWRQVARESAKACWAGAGHGRPEGGRRKGRRGKALCCTCWPVAVQRSAACVVY